MSVGWVGGIFDWFIQSMMTPFSGIDRLLIFSLVYIPRSFSSPLSFHLPLSFPGGSDTQGLESDPKAGTFPGYTLVEPIEREFWALLKRGNSGLCSSAGNLGFAQECGNPGFCAAHPCNSNELQGGAVPAGTPHSSVSPPSK